MPGSRVVDLDLSGSSLDHVDQCQARFDNLALAGSTFRNTSRAQVSIEDCNLEGLRINGPLARAQAAGG